MDANRDATNMRRCDDQMIARSKMDIKEIFARDNFGDGDDCFWSARDLMTQLGYGGAVDLFSTAVERAKTSCEAFGMDVPSNFVEVLDHEHPAEEMLLSMSACYLVAMNGDPNNPKVAAVQAYFASLAAYDRRMAKVVEDVQRLLYRRHITRQEVVLSETAASHGVENFPFFQGAGYRGMYGMTLTSLKARREIPKSHTVLDYMGSVELAANSFRVTQTGEKIRNHAVFGQTMLENAAEEVGLEIRNVMIRTGGTAPEDLPQAGHIKALARTLRSMDKVFAGRVAAPSGSGVTGRRRRTSSLRTDGVIAPDTSATTRSSGEHCLREDNPADTGRTDVPISSSSGLTPQLVVMLNESEDSMTDVAVLKMVLAILADHPGSDSARLIVRDSNSQDAEFSLQPIRLTEALTRSLSRLVSGYKGSVSLGSVPSSAA